MLTLAPPTDMVVFPASLNFMAFVRTMSILLVPGALNQLLTQSKMTVDPVADLRASRGANDPP